MKPISRFSFVVILMMLLFITYSALAQNGSDFAIDWFTFDGGGGTSSGGAYSVSGTIGQADAGAMNGGSYSIVGGFWGVVEAVQTGGVPLLQVTRSGSNVVVDWPFPSSGFVLQQASALAPPPSAIVWTDVLAPAAVQIGGDWTVTIASPTGNRFFRLRKP
jgi:hypothetical protein